MKRLLCLICCLALASMGTTALASDGDPQRCRPIAEGANDFAFALSRELLAGDAEGNLVCSPLSVWLPLAALSNATDPNIRNALLEAICAGGADAADANLAASRILADLVDGDAERGNQLRIANAVFVGEGLSLMPDFDRAFRDSYRGTTMAVDYRSLSAVDAVNAWASEHTDGLIDQIIDRFDPQTVVSVANAIYFSDRWDWEFNPERTEEGAFDAPTGEIVAEFMLREGSGQRYYEDDEIQAISLPFNSGGGLLILLPKDAEAGDALGGMTGESFHAILRDARLREGRLLLPKFEIQGDTMNLVGELIELGVPLFDPTANPLPELIEGNVAVWISDVLHKAIISVDEEGSTAAAVTLAVARAMGMPPEDDPLPPFEMICDKPFAFVLYGITRDGGAQVLFTGVVRNPQAP